MNIDKSKLLNHWFEDEDGNIITMNQDGTYSAEFDRDKSYTYHSKFPFVLQEEISSYNHFAKYPEPNFKHLMTGESTWNERVVLAMANSGDYTLSEAIYIYATACERCINVLWHKYVGEDEGYEEGSEEWNNCNTRCIFCEDDSPQLRVEDDIEELTDSTNE